MSAPILAASVAIFRNDEVLLIKRAQPPLSGHWTLPGGKRQPGETGQSCARREIIEELGLRLGPLYPVRAFAPAPGYRLETFAARWPETAIPVPSPEIADWQFVRPERLVGLKATPGLADILHAAQTRLAAL